LTSAFNEVFEFSTTSNKLFMTITAKKTLVLDNGGNSCKIGIVTSGMEISSPRYVSFISTFYIVFAFFWYSLFC
jgi:hypothetical protein